MITGQDVFLLLKRSLDKFFSNELSKNPKCIGARGEKPLISIIDTNGFPITPTESIQILRRLCKKNSLSNILGSHGIVIFRTMDIVFSYVIGRTFELNEFSNSDLDLKRLKVKNLKVNLMQ